MTMYKRLKQKTVSGFGHREEEKLNNNSRLALCTSNSALDWSLSLSEFSSVLPDGGGGKNPN